MQRLVWAVLASLAIHLGVFALYRQMFVVPAAMPASKQSMHVELRRHAEPVASGLALRVPLPVQQIRNPVAFADSILPDDMLSRQDRVRRSDEEPGVQHANPIEAEASALPAAPPFLSEYFLSKEVDRGPQIIGDLALDGKDVTRELESLPGHGRVLLDLWVSDSGVVDRVEFREASMPEAIRDVVVRHFRRALFVPAQHGGIPVRSRMTVEVVVGPPRQKRHEFQKFSNEYVGG